MKSILMQVTSLILPITVLVIVPLLIESNLQVRLDAISLLGALLCVLGLLLLGWTIGMFMGIGRGTLAPWSPPQDLVMSGPYAHVRNPMISGVLTVLLGEVLLFHSIPILVWFIVGFVVNHVYFVFLEEPGLVRRFGPAYEEYRRHVPRWIPRLRAYKPGEDDAGAQV